MIPASPPRTNRTRQIARPLLAAVCVGVLGATLWSQTAADRPCVVSLELRDAESGERLPGIVRVLDADGRAIEVPELLSRGQGLEGQHPIHSWHVLPGSGPTKVSLPQKQLTLTALSGLETEETRLSIDLRGKTEHALQVPLKRFYRATSNGLRSANTHLHLMKLTREQSDRYLREVPAADGLDLLFVSYLERAGADQDYITNRYTRADFDRLSADAAVAYCNGEEHRHNFSTGGEGYGHVMLLNLTQFVQPVSIGPGIMKMGTDGLPVQRGIDSARRDGGTAVWCHNHWGFENVPSWVLGRLDAQNIFDGGAHGSYKDSFYRYLNAGIRVPFSTGTDWFIYDFARVYVPVEGMLTPQNWLKSLAAGRSYITNGPFLEFTVAGKPIGDTIRLSAAGRVEIVARGAGRIDFRQLELVRDGNVVQTAPARAVGGHFEASARWTIDMTSSGWLALRTPPPPVTPTDTTSESVPNNEFERPLFSHTSPVYVEIAGKPIFDAAAARDLLQEVERSVRRVADTATFADETEKARVLQVYADAALELKRRIAE